MAATPHEEPGEDQRHETELQRLDRHWTELLQELRVVQTGVQILSAFLLTIPFQARFAMLSHVQRGIYLLAVTLGILATGLIIAPVSIHRLLFRKQERAVLVRQADLLAKLGLICLGLCLTTSVTLIVSIVVGGLGAVVAAVVCAGFFLLVWLIVPVLDARNRGNRPKPS